METAFKMNFSPREFKSNNEKNQPQEQKPMAILDEDNVIQRASAQDGTDQEVIDTSDEENQDLEITSIDAIQNLLSSDSPKYDEKIWQIIIEAQDKAAVLIENGNCKDPLKILEKLEKILELIATSGRPVDRNLVIAILYNIACAYQGLWVLDKCSIYADGAIFNIKESLAYDEETYQKFTSPENKQQSEQEGIVELLAVKLRKKYFLIRLYLQHCAVLSQMGNHEQALKYGQEASTLMNSLFGDCLKIAHDLNREIKAQQQAQQRRPQSPKNGRTTGPLKRFSFEQKNDSKAETYKEETDFLQKLLSSAIPFLKDVIKSLSNFDPEKGSVALLEAKKSLFHWKTMQENNEKYFRKEFQKGDIPDEVTNKRNILGVQHKLEWLENLNIGAMMHMKPTLYKDYASKSDLMHELTKDALYEKVSKLSSATSVKSNIKEEVKETQGYKRSESFHLKSIELVCRYVHEECPFINHLIQSYQKHYSQNLETIPEESFNILNEEHSQKEDHKTHSEVAGANSLPTIETDNKSTFKSSNNQKVSKDSKISEGLKEKNRPASFSNKKRGLFDKYKRSNEAAQEEELRRVYEKELANNYLSLKAILKENQSYQRPLSPDSHQKEVLEKISEHDSQEKIKYSIKRVERENTIQSAPSNDIKFKRYKLETIGRLPKRRPQLPLEKPKTIENLVPNKKTSPRILSPSLLSKPGLVKTRHSPREIPELNNTNSSKNEYVKSLLHISESPRGNFQVPNSSINVYFYKNFNKFIQNFYIKGEQQNTKQLEKKERIKEDKYAPYKSDYVPKKNLLFVRKGRATYDPIDKSKNLPENLRSITELSAKNPVTVPEIKQDYNGIGSNRHSQQLNSKKMLWANKQAGENNETEGKILGKSRSLKQLELEGGMKPSAPGVSTKKQNFSPRV